MFNAGDRVRLNSRALVQQFDAAGKLFPGLNSMSILTVVTQVKNVVYLETKTEYNGTINECWLEHLPVESAED